MTAQPLSTPALIDKQKEIKRRLYYEQAFAKIDQVKIVTWNWSAFFGGSIWCVYRKMYLRALLLILLSYPFGYIIGLVVGFAIGFAVGSTKAYTGLNYQDAEKITIVCSQVIAVIIWVVVYGALGNYWYYKHLQKKVKKGYAKLSLSGVDKRSAICVLIPVLGWLSALLRFLSERRKLNELKVTLPTEEFSDIPVTKEAVLSLV